MLIGLNSKILSFLLLFVLFFPSKYLYFYYFVIISTLSGLAVFNKNSLKRSFSLNIFLTIFLGVIVSALLPVIYFGSSLMKNFTEILRFIPVILLLLNFAKININYNYLFCIISLYTIINFLISFSQFNSPGLVGFITNLYSSNLHIENSLNISSRALGLSSGPGSNGSISALLSIFFLVTYFFHNNYKKLSIFFYILSFANILLSQSQTSFVAIILVSLSIVVYFFFKNIKSYEITRLIPFLFIMIGAILGVVNIYIDKLRYLFSLFEVGLSRSSYTAREDKVAFVMDLIMQNPFFLIFGHGKDFVPFSNAMDNEYVFIISVYGCFTLSIFIIWYLYSLLFIFVYKNIYAYLVTFTLAGGLIIAWPTSFILDSRLMFIFSLYLVLCLNLAYKKEINV